MTFQPLQRIIQGKGFVAEIIRTSRRKTASIKVIEGHVSIIVPEALPDEKIASLLTKKHRWIKEKLAIQEQAIGVKPKEFVSGEAFSYLGRNYRLKIEQGLYPAIKLHQGQFVVSVRDTSGSNQPAIKQLLIHWYKKHAAAKLTEKTHRYANIIGVKPNSITIKPFKAKWGSCSQTADIHYNWKIIMAPNRIVDYVVAHELCHILHHDHSPKFWNTVECYLPDYQVCKEWLRLNAKQLDI